MSREAQRAALTIDIYRHLTEGGMRCLSKPDGIVQLSLYVAEGLLANGWTHPFSEGGKGHG